MDVAEALAALGLASPAPWEQVKASYRRHMRDAHPDRNAADPAATARAARLNAAFAVLRRVRGPDGTVRVAPPDASPPGPTTAPPGSGAPERPAGPAARVEEGVTVLVHGPPDEAFAVLLEAAHRVGDVTYVDRSCGLVECLVAGPGPGEWCSLVLSFQGRGADTEVFCTVEPLGGHGCPPLGWLAERLVEAAVAG